MSVSRKVVAPSLAAGLLFCVALGKSASAPIEMDFYAGYKYEWSKGFAADDGVLQYYFPTSGATSFTTNPNTTELYAAQNFTVDSVTGYLKFSYAVTTLLGFSNSVGSSYTDLTAKMGAYVSSQGKALDGDTILATLTKTF